MKNDFICSLLNGCQYLTALMQTNEIYQLVQLVISALTTIVLLIFKIVTWWKSAKSDGKITKEEAEEGKKIVEDGLADLKDLADKGGKDENDNG